MRLIDIGKMDDQRQEPKYSQLRHLLWRFFFSFFSLFHRILFDLRAH